MDAETLKLIRFLPEVQDPFQLFSALRHDLQKPRSQLRNYRRVQIASKALKSLQSPFRSQHTEGFDATGTRLAEQLGTQPGDFFVGHAKSRPAALLLLLLWVALRR